MGDWGWPQWVMVVCQVIGIFSAADGESLSDRLSTLVGIAIQVFLLVAGGFY